MSFNSQHIHDIHIIIKSLIDNINSIKFDSGGDKVLSYFNRSYEDLNILKALNRSKSNLLFVNIIKSYRYIKDAQMSLSSVNNPAKMNLVQNDLDKAKSLINNSNK